MFAYDNLTVSSYRQHYGLVLKNIFVQGSCHLKADRISRKDMSYKELNLKVVITLMKPAL